MTTSKTLTDIEFTAQYHKFAKTVEDYIFLNPDFNFSQFLDFTGDEFPQLDEIQCIELVEESWEVYKEVQ